ncbi:MAG: ABC transporter permease [Oscillospiraceae bacterium]|jgi:putative ABC transport system permease protein|nr:ABC transporter permease [Oscillospiraceae bacterium]
MRLTDILRLSFINSTRGRLRTAFTVMAIAIGVASTLLVVSVGNGASRAVQGELEKTGLSGISLYPKKAALDSGVNITGEDAVQVMSRVKDVDTAMPLVLKYSSYRLKNWIGNLIICGVNESLSDVMSLELMYGRLITKAEVASASPVIILDNEFAAMAYGRENIVGKTVEVNIGGSNREFEIVGIISSQSNGISRVIGDVIPNISYMPYTTYLKYSGELYVDQIVINTQDDKVGERAADLLSTLHDVRNGFKYENISGIRSQIDSAMTIISVFMGAVAAISMVVAGIGIMNTMLSAAVERKREIGVYMALGASRRDIMLSFLSESAYISVMGGTIGVAAALAILFAAERITGVNMNPGAAVIACSELAAVLCGVVFGVLPAVKASRMKPIDALQSSA